MNNTKQKSKTKIKQSKVLKSNSIDSEKMDNRTAKRKTGDLGEELACKYLLNKGFTIKDRNYLRKYGEIDVVAQKDEKYYFFEVKTATHVTSDNEKQGILGDFKPEDKVNHNKLKRLARVIETYILDKKLYSKDWQVGVITVTLNMQTRLAKINIFNNIAL